MPSFQRVVLAVAVFFVTSVTLTTVLLFGPFLLLVLRFVVGPPHHHVFTDLLVWASEWAPDPEAAWSNCLTVSINVVAWSAQLIAILAFGAHLIAESIRNQWM